MSLVELTCLESGLFFLGSFKILEYPEKISSTLNYMFAEIFIDPWNNWDSIRRVFETFGCSTTLSNSSFSKNDDVGDGVKTSWRLNGVSTGVLVQCYNIANDLGILNDSTACEITFTTTPTHKEKVNRKKWQALATQYQIIKDVQTTQLITGFACSPLLDSEDTLSRSPQQLQMYDGYLAKTTITASEQIGADITQSNLYKCPFDSLEIMFPDLINVLRNDWFSELIKLDPVNVEYTDSTTVYIITATDISNKYFDFSYNNYVAHLEYIVILPTDSTADVPVLLKTCYGFEYGDSKTWDCTVCEYATSCRQVDFINPILLDFYLQNRVSIDGLTIAPDTTVKIVYKQVSIL